jgi:glucosamine-6-phosphate deaminase
MSSVRLGTHRNLLRRAGSEGREAMLLDATPAGGIVPPVGPVQDQARPEWHLAANAAEFAQVGADVIQEAWAAVAPRPMLIATGSTPMPIYRELARRAAAGSLGIPDSPVVQLDEYVGVGEDDPRSLYGWMRRGFLEPLAIPDRSVIRLRGDAPDPAAECARFEAAVEGAGGLGLAVLGLGPNGHVGFNEPPSKADAPSRLVPLTAESLESNARYWEGRAVPARALTTGMSLILSADIVVLVVSGGHKRSILEQAILGPESDEVPASHLRRSARFLVVADTDAAAGLPIRPAL